MLYVPAKWQLKGRTRPIRLIVIHCTVSPEQGNGAENVARYFATATRAGSTHLVSDNNSTVKCVEDENTAAGAVGANQDGLHLELVGYPDQSEAEWKDPYSTAMFHEAAPHLRSWASKYGIPPVWLTVDEILAGAKGFCTHAGVEAAYPSTGHWDPGPNFPKNYAMDIWFPASIPPPIPPPEDTDMPIIITALGRPARLLDAPTFVPLDNASVVEARKVGFKELPLTTADYDELRDQCARALGPIT